MKKFLLVVFFLLFGFTTTTTFADDAAASVDSAVAANQEMTLEWYIVGGPVVITIWGGPFTVSGSGSFQITGITENDIEVSAAEGYLFLSSGIYTVGDRIVVYATVTMPM